MTEIADDVVLTDFIHEQPRAPALENSAPETDPTVDEERRRNYRLAQWGSGILLGGVLGAGVATMAIPLHTSIGPLEVSSHLTISSHLEGYYEQPRYLDVKMASPLKVIGVNMEVTSLNDDWSAFSDDRLNPTATPGAAYRQLFTSVQEDKSSAIRMEKIRALEGAGGGAGAAILLGLALPYTWRRTTRKYPGVSHTANTVHEFLLKDTGLKLMAAGIGVCAVTPTIHGEFQPVRPTQAFQGLSELEDIQLTGNEAPFATQAAISLYQELQPSGAFYNLLYKNVDAALTPEYLANMPSGPNIVPIIMTADKHCNTNMDKVVALIAKRFDAKGLIAAGDQEFSGTYPFEKYCTAQQAQLLHNEGVKDAAVIGNHGSSESTDPDQPFNSAEWEKAQGTTVLEGNVVKWNLDGKTVTILGSQDPRRSRFGTPVVPGSRSEQTQLLRGQGEALGKIACSSPTPVDIVVTHDPLAAQTAMGRCDNINFGLSGHYHKRQSAIFEGLNGAGRPVFRFMEGTTGGAKNSPALGPLQMDASLDIGFLDTTTGEMLGLTSIVCHSDASVTPGAYTRMPMPNAAELKQLRQAFIEQHTATGSTQAAVSSKSQSHRQALGLRHK